MKPAFPLPYTPFPDYEREVAAGGAVTTRTTYRIAGQMVAVRAAGTLYYTLTDHLGNVMLLTKTDGSILSGSAARYDPFGNYRTWPTTNPGTTGSYNLGLSYPNSCFLCRINTDSTTPMARNSVMSELPP